MPKPPKNNKNKNSKKIILASIATVIFILISLFVYQNYLKTYPLGDDDKLQYVGQVHDGFFPPFSKPYTTYYYATNLTVEELVEYFSRKGYLASAPSVEDTLQGGYEISFHVRGDTNTVYLRYSSVLDYGGQTHSFKQSFKGKFFVRMQRDDYMTAKSALGE